MSGFSDMSRMIEALGKEKGIDKNIVINAVTQGMLAAAIKKYGTYREIEAQYNDESGEVELFEFKEVVEDKDFIDDEVEIKMTQAKELDPNVQVGDSIGIRMEAADLGRIAAQLARQIITQQVREAEREIIFEEFEQRKGEIASGIARRVERGAIVVDLGRTEAYIPQKEQIPGESYRPGDRVQGYIKEVSQSTRGPQIIMSRADGRYMMKLFASEVPEIEDGIIELMAAAREPGQRAKMAVKSNDPAVDPVGACVGVKGSRVQNVIQELRGEKIDIVPWDEDTVTFVCNALQPAEISKVFMDEDAREMEIVVPDDQLSLAIGKKGQNVRLAAKLTGWRLDIMGESDAAARTAQSVFSIMLIPGMNETMAQNIVQSGFGSIKAIAESELDMLMTIPGYEDAAKSEELRVSALNLIASYEKEGKEMPQAPVIERENKSKSNPKMAAEERLREELAQLQKTDSDAAASLEAAEADKSTDQPAE
jgi:transcription termination/antitermination protein NusA